MRVGPSSGFRRAVSGDSSVAFGGHMVAASRCVQASDVRLVRVKGRHSFELRGVKALGATVRSRTAGPAIDSSAKCKTPFV